MWILIARAPRPDAPGWPGRRALAALDAVAWPAAAGLVAMHLPSPAGVVAPVVVAIAAVCAVGRARRAVWMNHRYFFTSGRVARWVGRLAIIGAVLQIALHA